MNEPNIVRWKTGTASLSQRWTEVVGRTMRANQTPADCYRQFDEMIKNIDSVAKQAAKSVKQSKNLGQGIGK